MKKEKIQEVKDWRLCGQERCLEGVQLKWVEVNKNKPLPDRCLLCSHVIDRGFQTEDNWHFVCYVCYKDFHKKFRWQVRG